MEKEKSAKMILEEAFEKVNFSKLSSEELADLREYIEVKNIKKPKNAKPGFVVFNHYNTILVEPKEKL